MESQFNNGENVMRYVSKSFGNNIKTKEIEMSTSPNWLKLLWRSLLSILCGDWPDVAPEQSVGSLVGASGGGKTASYVPCPALSSKGNQQGSLMLMSLGRLAGWSASPCS